MLRAFHLAGARSVVASGWAIEDNAARALMTRFYENLWKRGMSKNAALREAQLAMRKGELTAEGQSTIASWAGWIFSGDFR